MPKAKPYSGPIDANLAAQLLNSSGVSVEGALLGDALRTAAEHLESLVAQSRKVLSGSEFAQIVADHLTVKMHRRGSSTLTVLDTGQVVLEIRYEEPAPRQPKPQRQRRVPLLDELKSRADQLGVDISHLGIKRKKIWELLQRVEVERAGGSSKGGEAPRRRRRTQKKPQEPEQPQEEARPEEDDPGPMSAGPDETRVTPALEEPKPPKRGFVKTSGDPVGPVVVSPEEGVEEEAKNGPKGSKKAGRPTMKQLVRDSKDVDIADLLSSESPD